MKAARKPPLPFTGTAAVHGFKCLADECEATCCNAWTIGLDATDCQKVGWVCKQKDLSPEEHFTRNPAPRHPLEAGKLHRQSDGACMFLEQGLCAIYRDFGERPVPRTCVSYPRYVTRFADHFELVGSLSCPEMARRYLLDEHGLVEEETNHEMISPLWLVNEVIKAEDLVERRGRYIRLLKNQKRPLWQRLASLVDPQEIWTIIPHFTRRPPALNAPTQRDYAQLWESVGEDERRHLLPPELDDCFTRYCIHFCLRNPSLLQESGLVLASHLALRVASLQHLIAAQPDLRKQPWDTAIRAVWSFTRAVEHDPQLTGILRDEAHKISRIDVAALIYLKPND